MKFRLKFKPKERNNLTSEIDAYIRGEAKSTPMFLEDNTLDALDKLEKEKRDATKGVPDNVFTRQPWLYYASLARDAHYARYRRTMIKAAGLNGIYQENYGGGKIAYDSKQNDE